MHPHTPEPLLSPPTPNLVRRMCTCTPRSSRVPPSKTSVLAGSLATTLKVGAAASLSFVHVHVCACTCVCMSVWSECLYTSMCVCVRLCVSACACVCLCAFAHICLDEQETSRSAAQLSSFPTSAPSLPFRSAEQRWTTAWGASSKPSMTPASPTFGTSVARVGREGGKERRMGRWGDGEMGRLGRRELKRLGAREERCRNGVCACVMPLTHTCAHTNARAPFGSNPGHAGVSGV